MRYHIVAEDKKSLLSSFHILVNGVPEFTRSGKKLQGSYFDHKDSLILNPGVNTVQFYVTNNHGSSSLKQTFEINNRVKATTSNLYLITIGCSKYVQSQYDLNYAEKDALDIERFFQKKSQAKNIKSKSCTFKLSFRLFLF